MTGWKRFVTEWEKSRGGKLTSSEIHCLLVDGKGEGVLGVDAMTYLIGQCAELLTGGSYDFSNHATDWGNEYEPIAAQRIKELYPNFIHYGKTFFEFTKWSGGSPDGVLFSDELNFAAEIKCPENPGQHIKYCRLKTQADLAKEYKKHYAQAQCNMMILADANKIPRNKMDGKFVSYSPHFVPRPESNDIDMSLFILDLKPDIEIQSKMEKRIEIATQEMKKILKDLDVVFKA